MKTISVLLFFFMISGVQAFVFGQSYEYKPATTTQQVEKTITLNNKAYGAKEVEIYVKNSSTYKWDYYQTVRIPGGESLSFKIGKNETFGTYGYFVVGTTYVYEKYINPFGSYPINIY